MSVQSTAPAKPRIHASEVELVPRFLVRGMFAMVMICLAMVSFYRFTDGPVKYTPPDAPVVMEKLLFLHGDMSGAAQVLDANGSVIADLSPQDGGFVSGVWRVLQRERTKARVALDGPVIVRRRENDRLEIFDPSTNWGADLMGFGADNAVAFAKLLH